MHASPRRRARLAALLAAAAVLLAAAAVLLAAAATVPVAPASASASASGQRQGLIPALLSALAGTPPAPAATPPAPPPSPCASPTTTADIPISLTSSSLARTAVLHVPKAAAGKALPLLFAFHGYGSNGPRFAIDSGLSALGDQQGYAVVYPSALGHQWAISGRERDVVLVSDLLNRIESAVCIDPRRVYATGVSIGAGMAARAGCELSNRLAALVLVSGGYRSLPPCHIDRPLSVLEIHGTSDTTVPYHGEGPTEEGAVLPYITAWAARDQCQMKPSKTLVAAHTVRYRWTGCASGAVVEHLRIYGSGHGLPNAPGPEISSGNRSSISGVRNIWHFLAARTLGRPFPDESSG
jgi:polyhydroxybutyrate depolymerase